CDGRQKAHQYGRTNICYCWLIFDIQLVVTGIWAAALDGDLDSVQRFIAKGTDPNQTDRFGYTALHYSSRHGNLSVCRLLLDSGADSNAQTHGGSTPLHRAAYCGHILVVKLLLDRGADPAMVDSDGRTALHKAAEGRQQELCRLLLNHNAGLCKIRDGRGLTAADMAPSVLNDLVPA
uniref:Ankyrin repeat domain 39 n=1 Tax=Leptobrachium leishanense TaxID=445787 RepID=A0A8C5LY91_9ANUR